MGPRDPCFFLMTDVQIRSFDRGDQEAVQKLILNGLSDHFAVLNPSLNPDLTDIWVNYIETGGCFLVAVDGCTVIGSGALIWETGMIGRIVRMSVAADHRRKGIGRLLVKALLEEGRKRAYTKIVVETNEDWTSAISLYERCGFRPYDHRDGEIHMQLTLAE